MIDFRGTKNILIESSIDGSQYSEVLREELTDRRNTECNAPLEMFDIGVVARYVRVTLIDFYELGSGLQYFNVVNVKRLIGKNGEYTYIMNIYS